MPDVIRLFAQMSAPGPVHVIPATPSVLAIQGVLLDELVTLQVVWYAIYSI